MEYTPKQESYSEDRENRATGKKSALISSEIFINKSMHIYNIAETSALYLSSAFVC